MDFGKTPDGTPVELYELTNGRITAKVMTYGGIVTELHVPDRQGNTADVVLGFETLDAYIARNPHFGAITGRVANRIAGASFTLDGKEYKLAANNGPNSAPRRPEGIRQGRLEGRGRLGSRRPRRQAHLPQPATARKDSPATSRSP